jgi:hypothetical protein
MELFRTTFPITPSEKKISYQSSIMFLGSCFSEYIGAVCSDYKFCIDNNPFGIVYNPLSVKSGLLRLITNYPYTTSDLFNHQGIWGSFDHHSRFSGVDANETLSQMNSRLNTSSEFLRKTNFLFLTFGTSYVYYLKSNNQLVSNCHKFPASDFTRGRITVEQIVSEYNTLLQQLFEINPNIEIVFTLSPVRHWKDGAHDNQLSKAILLLAIDKLCTTFKQTFYFPSYELIMDDLRDYRFYEEDMLHPNKIAIDYIWGYFRDCFIDRNVYPVMKEVEKIVQAARHRPFNSKSETHQTFVRQQLDKINLLRQQYGIGFDEEEALFNSV